MTTTAINRLNRILQAAREYRTYVRVMAKAAGSTCPIAVVDGDAAPHTTGSTGYYTTPGGRPVRYPHAYRRAWGKPVYHCSDYRLEVGREWLAQHLIPEWTMTAVSPPRVRRWSPADPVRYIAVCAEQLIRLGAFCRAGESAVGLGASPERILETMPVTGGWLPSSCQVAA